MIIDNWLELRGQRVQIRKNSRSVRTGYVEAVTPSADILWLEGDGAYQRQLFEKAEGYSAEPIPGSPGKQCDAEVPSGNGFLL